LALLALLGLWGFGGICRSHDAGSMFCGGKLNGMAESQVVEGSRDGGRLYEAVATRLEKGVTTGGVAVGVGDGRRFCSSCLLDKAWILWRIF
jgi:hypothetical protein